MPKKLSFVAPLLLAASVAAHATPANSATCVFATSGVKNGLFDMIIAKGIARKMSKACERARRKCERRLNRARRKGKVAHRNIRCGRA